MKCRWIDMSSESFYSKSEDVRPDKNESIGKNIVRPLPPTHTYEIENSRSGLNILLSRTTVGEADARIEAKVKTDTKNVITNEVACTPTALTAIQEGRNEDMGSSLKDVGNKNRRKVQLKPSSLRKHLGELSSLTPAKRILEETEEELVAPVNEDRKEPEEPPTGEGDAGTSGQNVGVVKNEQRKKKRRKADTRRHGARSSVPQQWLNTDANIAMDRKSKRNRSRRKTVEGTIDATTPEAGSHGSMPFYCAANFEYMPVLIPAIIDKSFMASPPLHQIDGMHSCAMNAAVANIPAHASFSTTALPMYNGTADQEDAENGEKALSKKRLESRLKEIAVGKSTVGYRNYVQTVPKSERKPVDPETPNPKEKVSASEFRMKCQIWRRSLHNYD